MVIGYGPNRIISLYPQLRCTKQYDQQFLKNSSPNKRGWTIILDHKQNINDWKCMVLSCCLILWIKKEKKNNKKTHTRDIFCGDFSTLMDPKQHGLDKINTSALLSSFWTTWNFENRSNIKRMATVFVRQCSVANWWKFARSPAGDLRRKAGSPDCK